MRTKALLLTAAIGAAGVASSLGQGTVYSVNAVGFINLTASVGYSMLANQLNGTNNNINTILPVVPIGCEVLMWDAASQGFLNPAIFEGGSIGWGVWDDNLGETVRSTAELTPGVGFFFNNGGAAPLTLTMVGEVPQGTLSVPLSTAYSLIASAVPQSAGFSTLGFPGTVGMEYLEFDAVTKNYKNPVIHNGTVWTVWDDNLGEEVIVDPTPAIGQGFFLNNPGAPTAWTRSFSVNN